MIVFVFIITFPLRSRFIDENIILLKYVANYLLLLAILYSVILSTYWKQCNNYGYRNQLMEHF